MKVLCAWCGKKMGEKQGDGVEGVSHGICKQCSARVISEVREQLTTIKRK